MNRDVENYLEKYPDEIKKLFHGLREMLLGSVSCEICEKLWAKLPSYYSVPCPCVYYFKLVCKGKTATWRN